VHEIIPNNRDVCGATKENVTEQSLVSQQNHQTNDIGFITAVTTSSANPTHYLQQLPLEATTDTTVTNSGSAFVRPSAHCNFTTNQHYNSNIGL